MKRAALISLLALCAACRQQDPAVLIDMSGPFIVPANADKLHLEVVDWPGGTIVRGKDWCYNAAAGCDVLPPMPQGFSASVTIVESGSAHQHVKINVELMLGTAVVGLGTATVDFAPGQTVAIEIPVTRPTF